MKNILKLLKARTVSFFTLPVRKFWLEVEKQVSLYTDEHMNCSSAVLDLERDVSRLEDNKMDRDDFNCYLWDDSDWCELDDKVSALQTAVDELDDESIQDMIDGRLEELINKKFTIEITLKPKE
jgi:hypothetical protein